MFGWHAGEPYVLAGDDVPRFCDFWLEFKVARRDRVVESGLRRFGYARERALAEDEIVDLMIAAESLFLSEMNTRGRGELRFRLAARAASLLGSTVDERLSVWRFMRGAYDARSVIVHGGTPAEKDLHDLQGKRVRIDLYADELEDVLRRALQTAIRQLARGGTFPLDWEALMSAGPSGLGRRMMRDCRAAPRRSAKHDAASGSTSSQLMLLLPTRRETSANRFSSG